MTYQDDFTLPPAILEQVADHGLDYLPEFIRTIINSAMQAERERYLNASHYERNPERKGQANGYKPKTVKTRVGPITFLRESLVSNSSSMLHSPCKVDRAWISRRASGRC